MFSWFKPRPTQPPLSRADDSKLRIHLQRLTVSLLSAAAYHDDQHVQAKAAQRTDDARLHGVMAETHRHLHTQVADLLSLK